MKLDVCYWEILIDYWWLQGRASSLHNIRVAAPSCVPTTCTDQPVSHDSTDTARRGGRAPLLGHHQVVNDNQIETTITTTTIHNMELKVWVEGIQRIVCGVTEKTTCQVTWSTWQSGQLQVVLSRETDLAKTNKYYQQLLYDPILQCKILNLKIVVFELTICMNQNIRCSSFFASITLRGRKIK